MRLAIATICTGKLYNKIGEISHPSLKAYAKKCNADFIVWRNNPKHTHPGYQKLEIKELLEDFDRVLYLDTDIIIRPDAPNLFDIVPLNQIGVFDEGQMYDRRDTKRRFLNNNTNMWTEDYTYYNTGVLLVSQQHKDIFTQPEVETLSFYEQTYLNYSISKSGHKVFNLPYKFNRTLPMSKTTKESRLDSFFLHYAGQFSSMDRNIFEMSLRVMRDDLQAWQDAKGVYNFPPEESKDVVNQTSPEIPQAKNVIAHIPAHMVPTYIVGEAFKRGTQNNILINSWGGLGDQICAEPAIRYALRTFKDVKISLASRCPPLYSHLEFEKVYDTREETPRWENYLVLNTMQGAQHLLWEFASHTLTHCVDFPAISLFRMTLPNADKEIQLPDFDTGSKLVEDVLDMKRQCVMIHAGKHWPSKTFPRNWWESVIGTLTETGFKVVLVGATVNDTNGYVDVDSTRCVDLRDKLSIPEFIQLMKGSSAILSNDSSPIHAAAAGNALIGMVASCKHPDYITHWRKGQFGYKTKNFGQDGAWNHMDCCPVQEEDKSIEFLPPGVMERILPDPNYVAAYYEDMLK